MASINTRRGKLYIDFRYKGKRCREQTVLNDTETNRRKLTKFVKQIEADIRLGCFVYSEQFPDSPRVQAFQEEDYLAKCKKENLLGSYKTAINALNETLGVKFADFCEEWYSESEVLWKASYKENVQLYLNSYLIPRFGADFIDQIKRPEILKFRAELAKPKRDGSTLSNDFINHVMTPLRIILKEASIRFGFDNQFENIKPLKVERKDINPFSLEEVNLIINSVRADFKDYFIVRFFTGMRTSEIDGLKWKYVNFDQNIISIRETFVHGRLETTKNKGSRRDIQMSTIVRNALLKQHDITGGGEYVFCNRAGGPLDRGNFRERIWKPTLEALGLEYRRPYETRHTAASLWLASGEAPEWIARQMGHSNTKMLFEIYSRFVPNLTRKDGSAFENLIKNSNLEGIQS